MCHDYQRRRLWFTTVLFSSRLCHVAKPSRQQRTGQGFGSLDAIMCDHLQTTSDSSENYHVDNPSRSVGQVVTVYCKNATVAIVKCMPDFKWNATVPSCTGKDGGENMGALIIVVWVIGGVLLFSLLVLIVTIITARSKTACGFSGNGSPSTSVFHISGAAHRTSGTWGDNPGFSRGDERCGEWSFHRARPTESERLPSYQEAILNNYIRVPARTGNDSQQGAPVFVRVNAPPSYRSSQIQNTRAANGGEGSPAEPPERVGERLRVGTDQTSENQNIQSSQVIDVEGTTASPVTETRSADPSPAVENVSTVNSQINSNVNTGTVRRSTNSCSVSGADEPQASTVISRDERSVRSNTTTSISRRYAENYPQCLFQDDPPPPYSSGRSRNSVCRSSVEHRQQPVRESYQDFRRSMHVAPSRSRRNESELRQSLNFRRSMHDRPENTAGPFVIHSNRRPQDHSNPHQNTNAFCGSNDTGYQSFSRTPYLPTHSSSLPYHAARSACQAPGLSDDSHHVQTFPADSSMPTISSSASLQRCVPAVAVAENRNIPMNNNTNNGHNSQNTLYIVRNIQASSSFSPHLLTPQPLGLSSHPHHPDTQPLCTSTPINQSPATDRRFVPANHPSPLIISRNQHGHSGQEELIFQRLRAELDGRYAQGTNQEQSSLPRYPFHSKLLNPSHNPGEAPIARLESEFL